MNTGGTDRLGGIEGGDDIGMYLVAVASGAYALYLLAGYSGRWGTAIKHLGIWLLIFLAVIGGYSYRQELTGVANRMAGELLPPGQSVAVEPGEGGERAVRIRRRGDGHFVARADIDGAGITMLVDTGASTVVLKPADAERAGIDLKSLAFTVPVQTANGATFAAPVRLRSISIGGIAQRDVEALVAKPGSLKESLLGMSFLRRLRSYEFSGEFLTLRS
jgi:aspartyl protease family protein